MFTDVVAPGLLSLIRRLAGSPEIAAHFYLAGGTALALQLGHRRSDDLDFFSAEPWPGEFLEPLLVGWGGSILVSEARTVHVLMTGGRVSFFHYPYPLVTPCLIWEGLRLASVAEIGCMKVIAISQWAEKKDFFDLMAVLQKLPAQALKDLLVAKYGARRLNFYHIMKSLLFFAEAEGSPEPVSLTGTTWEEVKAFFLSREKELWQVLCLSE